MEKYIPMITDIGIKVLGVLLIFAMTWILAKIAKKAADRTLKKHKVDITLTNFIENALYWLILLLGGLSSLSIFGVQTTSFAAVIGAAGLAIGLAFQGTLSNLAAGMMLLIFRPFKAGQVVSVAGKTGKVNTIGLFATDIDTPQNIRIIIPNKSVFGSTIENFGYHETRRADVSVGTDYGADLAETRKVLQSAIDSVELKLEDGAHQVFLSGLGDSSIDWQVRVWAKSENYIKVLEATTVAVKVKLDEAGIGIPYPQMDVHMDKVSPN